MTLTPRQKAIQVRSDELFSRVSDSLLEEKRLAVIEAPPGSGKTHLLLRIVDRLVWEGWRVALATQTNSQANDIAARFAKDYPVSTIVRLSRSKSEPPADFPANAKWATSLSEVPKEACLAVSTAAKWATIQDVAPFDLLAIDEAWQMDWAKLMQCADLSEKFLLIGDPGQIEPVSSVETLRWGTSRRPPHKAAPEVVKSDPELIAQAVLGNLPACRRLPFASVDFVKPFYDFDFESFAEPGDRSLTSLRGGRIVDALSSFEPLAVTIPTPSDGPPQTTDSDLAKLAKKVVQELMHADVLFTLGRDTPPIRLEQKHIGVVASHRSMNGLVRKTLGAKYSDVRIDTPERWQGLEVPFMIAIHPLSGVSDPSEFDLATGRLCVMASRHQIGLVVISRDHVGETLARVVPSATQAPGVRDHIGRGLRAHSEFWKRLEDSGRVIRA